VQKELQEWQQQATSSLCSNCKQSKLSIEEYVTNLVNDTMSKGLISKKQVQAVDLSLSLNALLLRVKSVD
jgi:hypothetical protein